LPEQIEDSSSSDYTEHMVREQSAWWKQLLDVQRPYRWNLARLKPGRTLDVGCGLGRNLAQLRDGVGVDHNRQSVAIARGRGLRAWTTDEWPTCPDAIPGSFDTMLIAHVLEHLTASAAEELIATYEPYLTPVARLVLIGPQERGYVSEPTHVRWVDFEVMERTARTHGFEPARAYSFPFPRLFGRVFRYNEFVMLEERHAG
jgi:SAM-dependent methyltransferase